MSNQATDSGSMVSFPGFSGNVPFSQEKQVEERLMDWAIVGDWLSLAVGC